MPTTLALRRAVLKDHLREEERGEEEKQTRVGKGRIKDNIQL